MKTFNFYYDESCHLEKKDDKEYMLIAYVSSAYNQVRMHNENILLLLYNLCSSRVISRQLFLL